MCVCVCEDYGHAPRSVAVYPDWYKKPFLHVTIKTSAFVRRTLTDGYLVSKTALEMLPFVLSLKNGP